MWVLNQQRFLSLTNQNQELHRASSFNETTGVYKFSNIRYAQAPIGNLRFRAPVAPLVQLGKIQTGAEVRACPQGIPLWQLRASKPIGLYSNGKDFSLESWEDDIKNYTASVGNPPPTTEDCLFLDVHVPRKVFNANKQRKKGHGAPVLVWVSGTCAPFTEPS
jgi:carboxylesterase type B